jgi:CDP-glucose 4,6-dehydratase
MGPRLGNIPPAPTKFEDPEKFKTMRNAFWQGRTVFVTGGTGLMGGWLVKALRQQGAEVATLVRDHSPRSMLVEEGILDKIVGVSGCLEDLPLLERSLAEYSVDTVFHLAAQPLVGVAKLDPVGTLRANVLGTWNLLEAARRTKVPRVIVASSDKAYGASDRLPYRETHPLEGRFPYDVSKSCADLISRMYAETYGMQVGILRCGNLFGGGDLNFNRTVPGVIRSTLRGERFVIRSDGKFIRDFLYVKDAATAYLLVAEKLAQGVAPSGDAYNFSLGLRLTVLDVVYSVLGKMGRMDLEPVIQNAASSEIREQYLDASKARHQLGWEPIYTMDQAMDETIDWYRRYFDAPPGDTPGVYHDANASRA